jgi:hypothetical protein
MGDLDTLYAANKTASQGNEDDQWLKSVATTPATAAPTDGQAAEPFQKVKLQPYKPPFGQDLLEGLFGTAEGIASAATSAVAFPIEKIATEFAPPGKAEKVEDWFNKNFVYHPQLQSGKQVTAVAGAIGSIPFKPAEWAGDLATWVSGNPDFGRRITNVGDVATMLLVPHITEVAKGRFSILREGKPQNTPPDDDGTPPPSGPKTKAQKLAAARGDLTADMDAINQRAHDELQAAYDQIPGEEWDKFWQDGKPKNIENLSTLLKEHADRMAQEPEEGYWDKLPQVYKDAIKREAERAKQGAENLKDIAKDAKDANAEFIVIPGALKPRETVPFDVKPEGEPVTSGKATTMNYSLRTADVGSTGVSITHNPDGSASMTIEGEKPIELKPDFVKGKSDANLLKEAAKPSWFASKLRPVGDIARDLKTALLGDERGSIEPNAPIPPERIAAVDRLKKDFSIITRNAARTGKNVSQYLMDIGFDPETVKYLAAQVKQPENQQQTPPPELRINLDRISASDSVKDAIANADREQQTSGRIEETTRGVRGHETTIAASQKSRMTVQKILNRKPGEVWNAEQQTAARDIRTRAANNAVELASRALSGDEKAANDLPVSLALLGELHAQDIGAGAEIARSLEARKIMSEGERVDPKKLADLGTAVRGSGGDPKLLAARVKALETPQQLGTFTRQFANLAKIGKTGKDTFLYCWINGMLSNPVTHVKVFGSNLATLGAGILESAEGYAIGKAGEMFGREPGQGFNEAGAKVEGIVAGFQDALNTLKNTWKNQNVEFGKGRPLEDNPNPLARENLGTSGAWGAFLEYAGNVIGAPGRALMAEHQFFASLNYRAQLHVEALKEAGAEGLTGQALEDRVNHIKEHPEDFPSINDAARAYGEKQGFLSDLGPVGSKVQQFFNASLFTKLVVPFVKIPLNMFKYSWERMPALNMISKSYWSDIAQGGAKAEAAMAKTGTGIMAAGTIAYLAYKGFITGNGPEDPKLRKVWLEHHQPNSVKVGDRWVSFSTIEPLSKVMGATAEVMSLIDEHNLDNAGQYLSASALALSQLTMQQSYMEGLSNVVNLIKSRNDPAKAAEKYLQDFAGSLVPAGVRQADRTYFDRTLREVNSIADGIRADVPGLSKSLPPRRGFWGQPIVPDGALGPDMLSPYKETKAAHDAVDNEIIKNRVSMGMPQKTLFGPNPSENPLQGNEPRAISGVKLTPKQYDDLVVFSRNDATDGNGNNLKDALKGLISSDLYQQQSNGPDGGKALLIKKTVSKFDQWGEAMLLDKYPDLKEKILKQKQGRIDALMPGGR